MKLSGSQLRCLRAVNEAGSVSIGGIKGACYGIAAGEILKFMPETYLRLVGDGMLQFIEPRRLAPTKDGKKVLETSQ